MGRPSWWVFLSLWHSNIKAHWLVAADPLLRPCWEPPTNHLKKIRFRSPSTLCDCSHLATASLNHLAHVMWLSSNPIQPPGSVSISPWAQGPGGPLLPGWHPQDGPSPLWADWGRLPRLAPTAEASIRWSIITTVAEWSSLSGAQPGPIASWTDLDAPPPAPGAWRLAPPASSSTPTGCTGHGSVILQLSFRHHCDTKSPTHTHCYRAHDIYLQHSLVQVALCSFLADLFLAQPSLRSQLATELASTRWTKQPWLLCQPPGTALSPLHHQSVHTPTTKLIELWKCLKIVSLMLSRESCMAWHSVIHPIFNKIDHYSF